jgi:hypothetical protein
MMPGCLLHGIRRRAFARAAVASAVLFVSLVAAATAPRITVAAVRRLPAADSAIIDGQAGWTQRAKLVADGAANSDYAGRAVALAGNTAVVGAAGADTGDNMDQGAAFVYVRDGGSWTQQARLVGADSNGGDEFGFALAISGDTLVVGARFADIGSVDGQGAAYVFVRSGSVWTQQAKLVASDGARFDGFGNSVAIDGDSIVVGAQNAAVNGNDSQGAAYVFGRTNGSWNEQAKLTASNGVAWVQFARAVSIRGDVAVIGAVSATVGSNTGQGAAYVYTRAGETWSERARLVADDGEPWSGFGGAVALDTAQVLIGSSSTGMAGQGAAYVFTGSGGNWTQQAKLTADDAFNGDAFGNSVALAGGIAIAGSLFSDLAGIENSGAAYVYARSGTTWIQQAKLVASDASEGAEFGIGVALDGHTALVGAELAGESGNWPGAAYVFESAGDTCTAPLTESFDGVVVPALPAGWTFTAAQGGGAWQSVNDATDSAPNAMFAPDLSTPTDLYLDSPVFVPQAGATLAFRQRYDLEPTYDGGVLEISMDGAPFVDILQAGGGFVAGGYADTMIGSSAIAGRAAWTGDTGNAFITTTATYPSAATGQSVRLRWRLASDVSAAHQGWWIDTVSFGCATSPQAMAAIGPSQLAFTLAPGASASDTLSITNMGDAGSSLHFGVDEADDAACTAPAQVPWLAATPVTGDLAAGSGQAVSVAVDTSDLAAGEHVATLCVHTSDAAHALVVVPVTLTVSGADPDLIFNDGFENP